MRRAPMRLALACLLLVTAARSADEGEYAKFFKPPVTPAEFWNAIKFERNLGSPEVAAKYLRGLLLKNPTDEEILKFVDAEKDGVIAFSRLVAVREWTPDAKANKQARADAEELLKKVQDAIRKRAKDEAYIDALLFKLKAETREERTYAVRELIRVGVPTVPYLLEEYGKTRVAEERFWLRRTLEGIRGAAGPLLATLDSSGPDSMLVKLEVLDLLRRKYPAQGREIVPFLWFPSANPEEDPAVRKKAKELLADLLELPVSRLPVAKAALTREAERYLAGDVRFGDPIVIWRWDGKKVVEGLPGGAAISKTKAEEYYGLRFARQALELDPDYRPAQAAFLKLAIDKADGKLPDALATIINKADLTFLLDLLDKSMAEERTAVVLPLVRAIGKRGEVRAKRPLTKGESPLVKALEYPDLRVRLAAVEALLAIPGPPVPHTANRILEILKSALSPAAAYLPGTKVLVAIGDDTWRARVVRTLTDDGVRVVEARTGRDAMRRLKDDGGIQALVTESTLPFPGMAHFLAQVRADIALKKLPIVLAAVPESRAGVEAASKYNELARKQEAILKEARRFIEDLASAQQERDEALRKAFAERRLFPEAFRKEVARIDALYAKRTKDLAAETPDLVKQLRLLEERHAAIMELAEKGYSLSESARRDLDHANEAFASRRAALEKENFVLASSYKRLREVEAGMKAEAARYDLESRIREGSLARFASRYPGVAVVQAAVLVTPPPPEDSDASLHPVSLRETLSAVRRAADPPPPKAAELGTQAETALRILHGLATGSPPGYDVAPVEKAVLDALNSSRLSEQGQLDAVGIAARLAGARPQRELAAVLTGGNRAKVRLAAADALIQHIQKHGNVLPAGSLKALDALASEPKLDAALKEKAELLSGILRGGTRSTGDGLRDYKPAPPVPVIPPPKEKDKDKED